MCATLVGASSDSIQKATCMLKIVHKISESCLCVLMEFVYFRVRGDLRHWWEIHSSVITHTAVFWTVILCFPTRKEMCTRRKCFFWTSEGSVEEQEAFIFLFFWPNGEENVFLFGFIVSLFSQNEHCHRFLLSCTSCLSLVVVVNRRGVSSSQSHLTATLHLYRLLLQNQEPLIGLLV